MKSIYRTFLLSVLLVVTAVLAGCGTRERIVTVKETTTTVLSAPKKYTTNTVVPSPPFTKLQYDTGTWPERAQYNADLNVLLYGAIGQCNADKTALRDWEVKEKANVEKANKAK